MSLAVRALRGLRELRGFGSFGDPTIPPNSAPFGFSALGAALTEQGVLSISTALMCIRVLSEDSQLPFRAFQRGTDGAPKPVKDPPQIVAQPFGPDLTPQQGFGQMVVSRALRGNSYGTVADRDKLGFPIQLQILHPDLVAVDRSRLTGQRTYKVSGQLQDPTDMVHVPGVMLPGAVAGIDPISYYRVTLGLSFDMQQYAGSVFKNGATPFGILKSNASLTRAQARQIANEWNARHRGAPNANKIAVLGNGAEFQAITMTPEQAQLLMSRAFGREEVAGMFGVPTHRLMVIVEKSSQGGGKGLEAMDLGYVTHTLVPIFRSIEAVWNAMIPPRLNMYVKFDVKALLRADTATRGAYYSTMRTIGAMNNDEIRAEEDMPPIPGGAGTDYAQPLNSAVTTAPTDSTNPDQPDAPDDSADDGDTGGTNS